MINNTWLLLLAMEMIDCRHERYSGEMSRNIDLGFTLQRHHSLIGINLRTPRDCERMARRMHLRHIVQGFATRMGYCYLVSRRVRLVGSLVFRLLDNKLDYRYENSFIELISLRENGKLQSRHEQKKF